MKKDLKILNKMVKENERVFINSAFSSLIEVKNLKFLKMGIIYQDLKGGKYYMPYSRLDIVIFKDFQVENNG